MKNDIGNRIAYLLNKNGMSQKELAERVNVSMSVISRYISGQREPKANVLANIATVLKTTSDYLLGIENNDFNQPYIKRMLARNADKMTMEEKKELIEALFWEE